MEHYSSLRECAAVLTLGGVDIEDGVPGRDQVECGREEVNDGEKHEGGQNEDQQRSNTHHGWHAEGMKRAHRHIGWLVLSHAV